MHIAHVWQATLCLAGLFACLGAGALQSGTTGESLAEPALGRIVESTYIEKSADPLALQKQQGYQIGGINTRFNSAQGKNLFNLTGGLFYSRETSAPQLFTAGLPQDNALGLSASLRQYAGSLGLASSLLPSNQLTKDGKAEQAIFQRLNYQGAGLNLSGSYSDIGKDFQGFTDLTKQMNAADASLLGLGMTKTNVALNYTGIKGMRFSTSRDTTENGQNGHAERGLTRTKQTHGLALALSPTQSVELNLAETREAWDPAVAKKDGKIDRAQTVKWTGTLGDKSKFSLGQSLVNTRVGTKETVDTRQNDLSLTWNEWKNLSFSGGITSKANGLNKQTTDTLNLALSAAISPRLQFTGKLVNNATATAGAAATENNLLDLLLNAKLSDTLQFTSGYKTAEVTATGTVYTRDHQVTWKPSSRWNVVSHLVATDNPKIDDTQVIEHTLNGEIGAKGQSEQMRLYTRREQLSSTVTQDRSEVVYTRPIGGGKTPAKLLVQTGNYQRSAETDAMRDEMLAMQLLNLQPGSRTTATLGYYDGPLLGAGYLTYRTWGQRNAGNLGVWSAQDFMAYREFGGEVVHRFTRTARLSLKQVEGDLAGTGRHAFTEYGWEQRFGTALFQGSTRHAVTPAKGNAVTARDVTLFKLTLPGRAPLPAWAANSMRFSVFQDGAAWGFGVLPGWIPAAAPASGLLCEKREAATAAGKPVDQYIVQWAGMLGTKVAMQLSHEDNPLTAGTTQASLQRRRYLHLAYLAQPKMQLFGRFVDETAKDKPLAQRTTSLGFIGQLSPVMRLQLQMDAITRAASGVSLSGNAYQLEFERTISAEDTLSLKWRLNAEEFSSGKHRGQVEASYKKVF